MLSWDTAIAFVVGVTTSWGAQIIARFFTERDRLRLEPVGPTCAEVNGAWFFYYEFKPRIGMIRRENSAAINAGGAVEVKDGRVSRHHAESFWAGIPTASTANLYAKKGLLVCMVYPKSGLVVFFSAGTAPHADSQHLGLGSAGSVNFDWERCRNWRLEITAAAPSAGARTAKTTVFQLCTQAQGATAFPGLAKILHSPGEITEGMLIKGSDDAIYIFEKGEKHHFPDIDSFISHSHRFEDVVRASDALINQLPSGDDMAARVFFNTPSPFS